MSRPLRIVSFVILLILLGTAGFVLFQAWATTPHTDFSSHLEMLSLPPFPEIAHTTEPRTATHLYRAAISAYANDPERYESLADTGTWNEFNPANLPALALLLETSRCEQSEIFKLTPEEIITYGRKPSLDALRTLGRICTDRIALFALKRKDYDTARQYLNAAQALGQNLSNERITCDELETGLALLGASAQGLARIAEDTNNLTRATELRAYDRSRLAFVRDHITPTIRVLRSIDAHIVGTHAGDIPAIATDSPELVWRTEAILALGRMRYFIGDAHAADQRAASKTLKKLSESPDLLTRAAAKAALDLTPEQYRSQQ
jgi:hypothetical protein